MNTVAAPLLSVDNTTEVARVRHQLALGLQGVDALTQAPMEAGMGRSIRADLASIGARPWVQRLDSHSQGRHALRFAGRYEKLLLRAVAMGDPLVHQVFVHGARDAHMGNYSVDNDPRIFVPRRLSLTPVLVAGLPASSLANARTAWLWPGPAYPLPSKATAVRGRIQRDLGAGRKEPIRWTRVVMTRAGAGAANLATEEALAWAHGDERGEFLLVLGGNAVMGAALPPLLNVNVWVFQPPVATVWDPAQPLNSLPLEDGGTAVLNEVLKGRAMPASYVQQSARTLGLKLGEVLTMNEADLLF